MPRVDANLGLKETNYEALTDMLQSEHVQSEGINLNPADSKYPQRRLRKYAWWRNQEAAKRRQIGDSAMLMMTPAEVQDALAKCCGLAREMSKKKLTIRSISNTSCSRGTLMKLLKKMPS